MKQTPTQMVQLFFRHVRVEVDNDQFPDEPINPLVDAHSLVGVKIGSEFSILRLDDMHERGQLFMTSLRVQISNERDESEPEQQFSPYLIDVEARATIVVLKGAESLAPPEDMAAVNGASMIWAAIREQVATITARMPLGPLVLPSMSFRDIKPSEQAASTPALQSDPVKASKRNRRSKGKRETS